MDLYSSLKIKYRYRYRYLTLHFFNTEVKEHGQRGQCPRELAW